jgi:hypothetical protein
MTFILLVGMSPLITLTPPVCRRQLSSGPGRSPQSTSYASYFPYSPPIMEATQWHANQWNIIIMFVNVMYDDVGEHALTSVRA